MHELSIAQSLIEIACETAAGEGAGRVSKLHVRIGAMSGVVADALHFSFDIAAEGTACEGARLDVEHVPVLVHCPQCDQPKKPVLPYCFVCPTCGTPSPKILQGQELELISLELISLELASS